MFVRALENDSTGPDFVLITAVDARTGESHTVCTVAPGLKAALCMELGIPYDETGPRRAHDMALQISNRVFRFSNPEALTYVTWPHYTTKDLEVIRAETESKSDSELLLDHQLVQSLYMRKYLYLTDHRRKIRGRYQYAVAHVLLERGIGCCFGCVIGNLNPYKPR